MTSKYYQFDDFRFDTMTLELFRDEQKIQLRFQPAIILLLLISNAPNIVTRRQLKNNLWEEGTHVEFNHGLNTSINQLRRALGDRARHSKYIETLPKRGYRFIGSIEQTPTTADTILSFITPQRA